MATTPPVIGWLLSLAAEMASSTPMPTANVPKYTSLVVFMSRSFHLIPPRARRLPDGRVIHVQVVANGPHHHLAGVEPHPKLNGQAMHALHLLPVAANSLLHAQGGIARAHGVVLVRQRRPKQRHDAIAHDLVDRPFITVHGRHHALEHGVQQLSGLFGVAVGEQLHGALQVGEQDGDLLALAFEGALGGQDFLGQMIRGVAQRRPGG